MFKFALRADLSNNKEFLPAKLDPDSTGWDVRCAEPNGVSMKSNEYKLIRLGFRMFAPEGMWLELRPRSSSFAKKHLHALYGVIDENFENELLFACQFIPEWSGDTLHIEFGERIGQVIPVRKRSMETCEITNEEYDRLVVLRNSGRGTGGFGSTGDS